MDYRHAAGVESDENCKPLGSGTSLLKPVQHIDRVHAQFGHGVAAFKHKHGGQACTGDVFADP